MLKNISRSLEDLLGAPYMKAVTETAVFLHGMSLAQAQRIASEKVEFFPDSCRDALCRMLPCIGKRVIGPLQDAHDGAATDAYKKAARNEAAPLGGLGCVRVGEDGRLYFAAKSEHYHLPLGHNFSGYKLIENAKKLGITNITHNNTRGFITRTAERQLVADVNGLPANGIDAALKSREPGLLNRVINLQTGSVAVEAGIKIMLSRFYRQSKALSLPENTDLIPVFLVMADHENGMEANYHGTTITEQTLRGMWPELYKKMENSGAYRVVPVRINDIEDLKDKIELYNAAPYRTCGFLHEIVLMNYGGVRLDKEYLQQAYKLCGIHGTPVLVDEIQSCMWYDGMFLFRHYGLRPDFVIIGKGFPGGEYAASKIITTYEMDKLSQFDALVTNGQEELASLAYLITMEFVRENGKRLRENGEYFEGKMRELQARHQNKITKIEGSAYLCAIQFDTVEQTVQFVRRLNADCIDVSAQTYKANCPPAALFKLPVITPSAYLDFLLERIDHILT